ncbi:MAG TPA: CopG family transcriptional regulator [Firmicutes bacterium]|nr:CopG family transcriptional regulator [Bacillota bacterium]
MGTRIGVVGIVVEKMDVVPKVNRILSAHKDSIVGRMGIPYRQRQVSVIALIVDDTTDAVGSLTGKLGALPGVSVKTALTKR